MGLRTLLEESFPVACQLVGTMRNATVVLPVQIESQRADLAAAKFFYCPRAFKQS